MDRLVHGEDRKQSYLLPEMLEDCIGEENPVRFIDAFIENIRPQFAEIVLGKEIILNSIADKGYQDTKDMALALENGIIPNVIPQKGKEKVLVEFEYKESEITEEKKKSRKQKDISECIHAGVVPEVYEGILTFEKIEEYRTRKYENTDAGVSRMTEEEMEAKAEEDIL